MPTFEEWCEAVRKQIGSLNAEIVQMFDAKRASESEGPLLGVNIPHDSRTNQLANLTLAFRHLEDARMRLGKVMQACQGGISKYDREAPAQGLDEEEQADDE